MSGWQLQKLPFAVNDMQSNKVSHLLFSKLVYQSQFLCMGNFFDFIKYSVTVYDEDFFSVVNFPKI